MPKPLPRSFSFQPRKSVKGKRKKKKKNRHKTLGSTKLLLTFREEEISIPCDPRETNRKTDQSETREPRDGRKQTKREARRAAIADEKRRPILQRNHPQANSTKQNYWNQYTI